MDYFFRCSQSDKPQGIALLKLLGEVKETEDGRIVGNGFVDIGTLYEPTGETVVLNGLEVPVTQPILAPDGQPYYHANLRTEQNLKEAAQALAGEHPELGEALTQLGKYLLLDEQGKARAPSNPQRVFF